MIILIILDGLGINPRREANAVALAKKPNLDRLWANYPTTAIQASGPAVGLPQGQMGNSEVGHLNIGAGRIVYQEITRIDKAIAEGEFFENPVLVKATQNCSGGKSRLHLLGLVSDGGVHSSQEHLYALLELAKNKQVKDVFIHAFLDGRDTSPTSGTGFLTQLKKKCQQIGVGKIASVMGRYWAMDRDKRWERTRAAYLAIAKGVGKLATDPVSAVEQSYQEQITDEFVRPVVIVENSDFSFSRLKNGDWVIFFNFRADRGRQLSHMLLNPEAIPALTDSPVPPDPPQTGIDPSSANFPSVSLVTLTHYDDKLTVPVAYPPMKVANIFGELISRAGFNQLRISETEKYPHVTFFFNGGQEKPFAGEERILIPSPKVATYDLQPEMSAMEVTRRVCAEIRSKKFEVIILNYANPDMVGHTGVIPAAVKAVETVDWAVGEVLQAVSEVQGSAIVTADHGNCEVMIDEQTSGPHTAHTTNPVPLTVIYPEFSGSLRTDGLLADIAPTMLKMLGMKPAPEMTGKSLLKH